jgi:streptomycin 6-kinase
VTVTVPAGLREGLAAEGASSADWLATLPHLTAEFLDRWQLRIEGPVMHGVCALVLPVRRPDDTPAVLKLCWPHEEARYEYRALATWAGDGAVALLAADPDAYVLLLERLHADRDLSAVPLDDALTSVGLLLRRLNTSVDGPFTRVADRVPDWSSEFAAVLRKPLPGVSHRLVECAAGLLNELSTARDPVLLHTDLHYENVLAADREPWLAIDPKPMLGDAEYEVAPLLWNRWPEATDANDLARHLRGRADVVAEAAGLDRHLVASWVVIREAVEVVDALEAADPEWREMSLVIGEAFLPRLSA